MTTDASLPPSYFDALYARDPDPWRFRTSAYEREKYDDTLAALEGRRFRSGVEVGCAIGELSARLGEVCDHLLGIDVAEAALEIARARNAASPQIAFQRMTLPQEQPPGCYDLIVLSEVLYYFAPADLERVAQWVQAALEPGGVVLLVHWLGETPDYPLTGDQATDAFVRAASGLTIDLQRRRERYRMDRLRRLRPGEPAAPAPA